MDPDIFYQTQGRIQMFSQIESGVDPDVLYQTESGEDPDVLYQTESRVDPDVLYQIEDIPY